MNHIYFAKFVLLKPPGFQSQKHGMPNNSYNCELFSLDMIPLQIKT